MFNPLHRAALANALSRVFQAYQKECACILQKYSLRRNKQGYMETATPLSAADRAHFIENRRQAMEALREVLPALVREYPGFLRAGEKAPYDAADPYGYNGTLVALDRQNHFFAYVFAFGPHQKTTAHKHCGGCASFVLEGDMMETECDGNGVPQRACPKPAGESTIVSPHPEQAAFDEHIIFSTGRCAQNLLLHVYDGYMLLPDGRVEDITSGPYLKAALDVRPPPAQGALIARG